jgi:2-succinyl-6-hydroxy-2,4-cyclohexadiene-1-carboxylate synthase
MSLHYETHGKGSRQICFVHGFTQTGKSWLDAAKTIHDITGTFIDAPDHGESQGTSLNLQETGDAIARVATGMVLVGYSMGARMALHAAIQHPQSMVGLVLVSGTPGIEDDSERAVRVEADEALALHIESVGTSVFIEEWIRQPLFADTEFSDAEIQDRCRNTASSLASSLRTCGTGQQEPLWTQLPEIDIPVLLIAGSRDTKFTAIATRMHELIPHSTLNILDNAGHNAHLDQPVAFGEVVNLWLEGQTNSKQ